LGSAELVRLLFLKKKLMIFFKYLCWSYFIKQEY